MGQKYGEEADAGAEMLRVAGNREQCFRRCFKQDVIDRLLVVEGDLGYLFGNCENDVEIFHRQQFGLPVFQPLRAV